ncbi:MAG: hypothetical protein U5R30_05955 [Deltaproteobacteria bacterium]|nr:hypothetical protein [Deltaproteobacteria bacterium]
MAGTTAPDPAVLLPRVPDVDIAAVAPRFEDGYVAMLTAARSDEALDRKSPAELQYSGCRRGGADGRSSH